MENSEKFIQKIRGLKESLKKDPDVKARYDRDGDGRISGEEWDLAREDVIADLESEAAVIPGSEPENRAGVVSKNPDNADGTTPDIPYEYGQIRVESFWGAIAMFCLCQIYYFILFEGFVFVSGAPATHRKILYVWFGILFLVSVSAQIEALIKIGNYFTDRPFTMTSFRIVSVEDFIKSFLAIIFGLFFILFCFGFYPFPSKPHQWWHTLLFYIVIWGLSVAAAKNLKGGIQSKQPLGLMNVIPVLMGFGFFIAGAFLGEVFYFAGTFGMGFALIPIRPLLLGNQTRLLKNKKNF